MGAVGANHLAPLLHQEPIARPPAGELGEQDLLGAGVGGGDEIGGTFERDLQLLDLAKVAGETPAGLAGGTEHDVHQGGRGHLYDLISIGLVMPGTRVRLRRPEHKPCAGHPRISPGNVKIVDGRDEPGHDSSIFVKLRSERWSADYSARLT